MKKNIFIALLTILILINCILPAFATDNVANVLSENLTANKSDTIEVPIMIDNNPGIMGFRITVSYSSDEFSQPSVEKGSVLSSGSFNDSIKEDTNGSFDVVWSDSKEVSTNGTLFVIKLKVESDQIKSSSILISYSASDTFNEKWEDVKLDCPEITVLLNGYEEPTPEDGEDEGDANDKSSFITQFRNWILLLPIPFNIILKIMFFFFFLV